MAALLLPAAAVQADALDDRVSALYQPFQAEDVALAPDGRHVAYTRHESGELSVTVLSVDGPSSRINVTVAADRDVSFTKKQPVRLSYLRWFTPDRLVIVPTGQLEHYDPRLNPSGVTAKFSEPIYVVDTKSHSFSELVDADDFAAQILKPLAEDTLTVQGGATIHRANVPMANSANFPGTPDLADKNENSPVIRPTINLTIHPRQINFIGPAADDPEGLLLEAFPEPGDTASPHSIIKVNIRSGKYRTLGDDTDQGQLLYDRQGSPRILYPMARRSDQRQFMILHQGLLHHWRPLGAAAGDPAASEFTVSTDNYFGHRAMPLAFDFDPRFLYYASNVGRDTFGVYQLDLQTGKRTGFAVEDPHVDLSALDPAFPSPALVFDEKRREFAGVRGEGVTPFTHWVDSELQVLQTALDLKYSGQTVEILQWDDARDRFLLRITGTEPSRYVIFERPEGRLVEFLHSAPWLPADDLNHSAPIEFDTGAGVHLSGYLTYPRHKRADPPPLLVLFPSKFLDRVSSGFDREAQVYAGMGFAVLRVNCRGSNGFGISHRDAILEGIDRVPIDDMLAAIDWAGQHRRIDVKRVAAGGEGFGGYLALRALQLHPDRFRCALSTDAPVDLENWLRPGFPGDFTRDAIRAWLGRSAIPFAEISVFRHPELLTKPAFLMFNPQGSQQIMLEHVSFRSKLRHLDRPPTYLELGSDYELGLPSARAQVFHQIEDFLNLNVYDGNVRLGPLKEIQ